MTPHTTCPLLWDGRRFRPIADVLPDLADWDTHNPGCCQPACPAVVNGRDLRPLPLRGNHPNGRSQLVAVFCAVTDTNHMTAKQSAYQVGTTVEVQMYDFKAPGQPLRWFAGVVEAVEQRDGKGKLVDVLVRMSHDGRPHREIVGPRGGNSRIRVAS